MKLEIKELVEAVKEELLCREEDAETVALRWESEFYAWLRDPKQSKKDITVQKGNEYFRIKDEDEIFEIADSYGDALEEGSVKKYWAEF